MTFKDIRTGYAVYMLDKTDGSVKAMQGKVTAVGQPRFAMPPNGQMPDMTKAAQMVVDVTIENDGATHTYEIPEGSSVVSAGQLVLSVDKEGITREVQAIKNRSEEALKAIPGHEKNVKDCEEILSRWDTSFAEKRENEARFNGIESEVRGLKGMIERLIDKVGA